MLSLRALLGAPAARLTRAKCPCTSGDPGSYPHPCGTNRPCSGEPAPPPRPVCTPASNGTEPQGDPRPPKRSGEKCITPLSPTPKDCDRSRIGVFSRIEAARSARRAAYEEEARRRRPAAPPAACRYAPLVSVPVPSAAHVSPSPRVRGRCPPPAERYEAVPPGRPPPAAVCTLRSPRYLARFPDPPAPARTCAAARRRDPCARSPPDDIRHDDDGALPGDQASARRLPSAVPGAGRCEPREADERRAFRPPGPAPCAPPVRYPYRPARSP